MFEHLRERPETRVRSSESFQIKKKVLDRYGRMC